MVDNKLTIVLGVCLIVVFSVFTYAYRGEIGSGEEKMVDVFENVETEYYMHIRGEDGGSKVFVENLDGEPLAKQVMLGDNELFRVFMDRTMVWNEFDNGEMFLKVENTSMPVGNFQRLSYYGSVADNHGEGTHNIMLEGENVVVTIQDNVNEGLIHIPDENYKIVEV